MRRGEAGAQHAEGLGGLALVAVAVVAVVLLNNNAGPRAHAYPVGDSPRAAVFDGQSVWVINFFASTLSQLAATGCTETNDPCGEALASFAVENPAALVYDPNGRSLWIAGTLGQSLTRFDVDTGEELGRYALPHVPSALLLAGDHLWTANDFANTITKIALDGTVVDSYAAGSGPIALTQAGQSIWVAAEDDGQLLQFDALTGNRLNAYATGGRPRALAFDGEYVWAALGDTNEVIKVNPGSGEIEARVPVGETPVALLYDGATLWSANETSNNVTRVDVATAEVLATVAVPGGPYALAWAPCGDDCGDLWVVNVDTDSVSRVRVEDE